MPDTELADYFCGDESEQFLYFRVPLLLITGPRFKHLSSDTKLLYGMLLDRMSLSAKNEWYDEDGRVYIFYTVDEISEDLNCGRDKAMKMLAELDTNKGVGLIERVKQGQGKPTKIFVKRFTSRERPPRPEKPELCRRPQAVENPDLQKSDMPTSRGRDFRCAEAEESDASYITVTLVHIADSLPHCASFQASLPAWHGLSRATSRAALTISTMKR